jgi:hypothetical protein
MRLTRQEVGCPVGVIEDQSWLMAGARRWVVGLILRTRFAVAVAVEVIVVERLVAAFAPRGVMVMAILTQTASPVGLRESIVIVGRLVA